MIIPVVITAIALGRSFDYKTMKSGSFYIFDQTEVTQNIQTIHRPFTNSQYRLIESSSDVNDFLGVNGELTLKAKRGQAEIQGYGEYVMKSINREKTVELLVNVYHETVTETFPTYTKQRTDWPSRKPKDVGSHYIASIIYGGRLFISYKMVANDTQSMEKIKAYLSGTIDSVGSLSGKIAGNFDKLEKEIGASYTLTINTYATTGSDIRNPTDMKGVLELVEAYPSMVQKINNGKGSPLKLEIVPIATLNTQFKSNPRTVAMESIVAEATNKYDDLHIADAEFKAWEGKKIWNDQQQKMIDDYFKKLRPAHQMMIHAIGQLDISAKEDLHHFDEAFEAYGTGGDNIPNRYMRELIKLQHEVEEIPYEWYPYSKSVTNYIHWGSVNCTAPTPEPIYVGYAATSPDGYGNGANFLCLPNEEYGLEQKPLSPEDSYSQVNGLSYQDTQWNQGFTYCAFCKLENASMVVTIPATKECPPDMKLEYSGFMTTNGITESEMLCLDGHPDSIANQISETDEIASKLVPLWLKCNDCEEDQQNNFVPCVVCSR